MNSLELARSPSTPKETLIKLSKDEDWIIRCGVALNPNTSMFQLMYLSKDKDEDVRKGVAINPNTTVETLISIITSSTMTLMPLYYSYLSKYFLFVLESYVNSKTI
jgi:pentose-5-phosphate-3-epimerase